MTNVLDSSTVDTDRRHREILRRTRMGLSEDLDDLRQELGNELEDFESRLRRTARHLPLWLDLPGDSLRAPFKLDAPTALEGTLIGPRTVATVAAEVEDFIHEWLGDADTIPAWNKRGEDDTARHLMEDLKSLEAAVQDSQEAVDELSDDGPLQLEQILESIVFELESRRETDVEALECLIKDGDVDPGRNARAEIAGLWEEQRRRVDELQRVWDDILNLHHEGITFTLDGLDELDELTRRARQGIEGAELFIELEPEPEEVEDSKLEEKPDLEEVPKPEQDSQDQLESEETEPDSEGADNTGPTEIPIDVPKSGPESSGDFETNPFLRAQSEVSEVSETEAVSENAKEHEPSEQITGEQSTDESDESEDTVGPTIPMIEEVAAKAAADASEEKETSKEQEKHREPEPDSQSGENLDLFSQTLPDAPPPSEPRPALNPDIEEEEKEEEKQEERQEEAESSVEPTEPYLDDFDPEQHDLDTAVDITDEEAPEEIAINEDEESRDQKTPKATRQIADDEPVEDRIRLRTFRIRDGWQTVSGDEIAATLGPPGLFVIAMLVLGLLSLLGLAENPMVLWDWALPASFGAMFLLVLLPLVLRWRPMWRGYRFQVIRRGDVEDEVDLRVTTDDHLVLDRTKWKLAELTGSELHRWESPGDAMSGWLLTVKPPYYSPFHLATFSSNPEAWMRSRIPRLEAPDDAWQIPPGEFDAICQALDVDEH